MIRDARITDSTFVPYAMTNRELTESISYKELYNQSTSLVANTLTDIVEFTVDHPVVLSAGFATATSTDKLDIFIYVNNGGSYTSIASINTTGSDVLTVVIPRGTFKVTMRCNTAQTSRPCFVTYK